MSRHTPRIPVALAALAVGSLALAACGSNSLSSDSSGSGGAATTAASTPSITVDSALAAKVPDKIKTAGTITIGTDATYAPNEFLDADGKTVKGMDVDLFNAVAATLGLKTQWQPTGFDSIILNVTGGKSDVGVSSFSVTPERTKQVNMVTYFTAGTQWVSQKGNPKKVDPENACGLSIGVQKATTQLDDLTARSKKCTDAGKPAISLVIQEGQDQVTADLVGGRTVAMAADSPVALYAVKQTGDQLEALGDVYDSAPYGIVVAKDQREFAEAIQGALKSLSDSGAYKQILSTWGVESGAITDFAVKP